VWISKAMESTKILLLTGQELRRITKKTDGMTLFLTDLDRSRVDIRRSQDGPQRRELNECSSTIRVRLRTSRGGRQGFSTFWMA